MKTLLTLRQAEWIPQVDGSFVRPEDADRDSLPEGFAFDPGWKWLEAIEFGREATEKTAQALQRRVELEDLGFEDERIYREALWFTVRRHIAELIRSSRELMDGL